MKLNSRIHCQLPHLQLMRCLQGDLVWTKHTSGVTAVTRACQVRDLSWLKPHISDTRCMALRCFWGVSSHRAGMLCLHAPDESMPLAPTMHGNLTNTVLLAAVVALQDSSVTAWRLWGTRAECIQDGHS